MLMVQISGEVPDFRSSTDLQREWGRRNGVEEKQDGSFVVMVGQGIGVSGPF